MCAKDTHDGRCEDCQARDTYVVFSDAPTPPPALSRDGGEGSHHD